LPAARQTRFNRQVAVIVQAHAEQRAQRPWRHGRPCETVVTGFLIAHDSTHVKRYAEAIEGQGWHYSTTDQTRMPGHSLFQSVYCLLGHQFPLAQILPQPMQSRFGFTRRAESDMTPASWSS